MEKTFIQLENLAVKVNITNNILSKNLELVPNILFKNINFEHSQLNELSIFLKKKIISKNLFLEILIKGDTNINYCSISYYNFNQTIKALYSENMISCSFSYKGNFDYSYSIQVLFDGGNNFIYPKIDFTSKSLQIINFQLVEYDIYNLKIFNYISNLKRINSKRYIINWIIWKKSGRRTWRK